MKAIFIPNDTLTNKISYYHLVLFLLALPFDQFYSEVVLISLLLHTLIHAKREVLKNLWRKEMIILSSVFLVTLLCTAYTHNQKEGFSLLSRQLAILLFPVIFLINPIETKKYTRPVLLIFAFALTLIVCYLYIDALRIIRYNHLPPSTLFTPIFLNHNFSEPIAIHATYLSLYLAMGLVVLVYYGTSVKKIAWRAIYFFAACLLMAGLIQLGSRATLIALLLIFFFVLPFFLNSKTRFLLFGCTLLCIATLAVLLFRIDGFKERLLNGFKEDLSEKTATNSIADPRMKRWDVAYELVKASPIVGYGAGDEVDLLMEKYFSNKLYDAYLNKLNAHNQYLSFLLIGGLFALAIYLFTLLFGLRLAIRSRNAVFLSFIILLLVVSVSENILSRNKGIFFYGFFFSLFVSAERKSKKTLPKTKLAEKTGNPKPRTYVYTNNL